MNDWQRQHRVSSQQRKGQFKWPPDHLWPSNSQVEWQEPQPDQPDYLDQLMPHQFISTEAHLPLARLIPVETRPVPAARSRFFGALPVKRPEPKQRRPRRKKGRKVRRWLVILSILMITGLVIGTQVNGEFGATFADTMRAVLGPTITAQIESWFLGISDQVHHVQYQLSGQQLEPPWMLTHARKPGVTGARSQPVMPLATIKPLFSPALPGEGVWTTDGLPQATGNLPPPVEKTFIRTDASRPYAIVTLVQFDTRYLALHMVAGTTQPGGPLGVNGPGFIPASDRQQNTLIAAFNGGFKYADGQFGMYVNGTTYVPPQNGAATIAVTKEGQIIMGAWGKDARLSQGNTGLAAWRQNDALLIDHGIVSSLANDGAAWGGTYLNKAYTWRSGLGITSSGSLIYAAGDYLSALTLGKALQAAGAVTAMQTDINPYWVRSFLYNRSASGSLQIIKLNPGMQGSGTEYFSGYDRDFFYLTRLVPGGKP